MIEMMAIIIVGKMITPREMIILDKARVQEAIKASITEIIKVRELIILMIIETEATREDKVKEINNHLIKQQTDIHQAKITISSPPILHKNK